MDDLELKKNGEGYNDPTAYEGITRAMRNDPEREKVYKLIGCINRICELSGFSLEERVVLKNDKTGRIWR